jgi:hypothetical protein
MLSRGEETEALLIQHQQGDNEGRRRGHLTWWHSNALCIISSVAACAVFVTVLAVMAPGALRADYTCVKIAFLTHALAKLFQF